jgi:hypothetical protein
MQSHDPEVVNLTISRRLVVHRAISRLISRKAGAGKIIAVLRRESFGWEDSDMRGTAFQPERVGLVAQIILAIVSKSFLKYFFVIESTTRYYPCDVACRDANNVVSNAKA